jgi:hypothetical protein
MTLTTTTDGGLILTTDFPFDDINRLEAEEEALPDIPHFPSIYGQATTKRQDTGRNRRRRVPLPLFTALWTNR